MKKCIKPIHSVLVVLLFVFGAYSRTFSATYYCRVASGNWNAAATWSTVSSTGAAAASTPAATDDVVIGDGANARAVTLNVTTTCASISIGTGVGASVLTAASRDLTVTGNVTIGVSGTITHSGTHFIQLGGNWSNFGSYTAANNNTEVIFDGTTQALVGATTFKKLTIKSTSTLTQTTGTIGIRDFVVDAGGTYQQQGGLILISHDWRNSSTFNATAGTVQFTASGGGAATFGTGSHQFFHIIVDSGVNPQFSANAGSAISIAGDYTNNNSGLTATTNLTTTFNGSGSQTITSNATGASFGHVEINKSGGTLSQASAIIVVGDWTNTAGTYSSGGNTVTFSGSGSRTLGGSASTAFGGIIIANGVTYAMSTSNSCSSLTFATGNTATSLTHSGSAALTVSGNVTINQPGGNVIKAWNINAGLASVGGNVSIGGTSTTVGRVAKVVLTTGTLSITGNLVYNSSATTPQTAIVDMSGGASTLNLAGALTLTSNTGTLTPGTSSTFNYNNGGTAAQTIVIGTSAIVYNNLHSNNTHPSGATFSAAISATNVVGNLRVQSGLLTNGGFAVVGNASKTFEVANGATYGLTGTTAMPIGFGTTTLGSTSVLSFAGAAQTIAARSYGHLNIAAAGGNKTAAGAITVNGNFLISAGTFVAGTYSHQFKGGFTNNGTFTANTSTATFNGSVVQTIGGSTATAFNNLTFNNANGIIITQDETVTGTLTMTTGDITTGSSVLKLGSSTSNLGTLSYTAGTIVGNFQRWFAASTVSNVMFPIGTDMAYLPANLSFTGAPSAGGTITGFFTATDPGMAGLPLLDGAVSMTKVGRDGFWTLTAANGLAGGIYSLDLTATAFGGVNNVSTLRIVKRANGGSNWSLSGSHVSGTGSIGIPIVHRTGMSGFSDFAIAGGGDNTLPVEMLSFTCSLEKSVVDLRWQTASEIQNHGFYLERMIGDASSGSFVPIGFFKGHGTTSEPQSYAYSDNIKMLRTLQPLVVSYRLRQVDFDGRSHVSEVVSVKLAALGSSRPSIRAGYPNPSVGQFTVHYTLPERVMVRLEIYNQMGTRVRRLAAGEQDAGEFTELVDMSDLEPGAYYYQFTAGTYTIYQKIVLAK